MAVEKCNDEIHSIKDWYNWDIIMSSRRITYRDYTRGSLAYFACTTTLTKNVYINRVSMLLSLAVARLAIINITVQFNAQSAI